MGWELMVQPKPSLDVEQLSQPKRELSVQWFQHPNDHCRRQAARKLYCARELRIAGDWRLLMRPPVLGNCPNLVKTTAESCHRLLTLCKCRSIRRSYATNMTL